MIKGLFWFSFNIAALLLTPIWAPIVLAVLFGANVKRNGFPHLFTDMWQFKDLEI